MKIRAWAIGIFIVLGFALFTAILFLIGSRQKAFSSHLDLYTEFSNLGGLTDGAKVQVSGLDAGQLKKVYIPKDPSEKFRLELELEEKVHGMIRKDSVVSIETQGVVGDKFLMIKKGTDGAAEIQAGGTLPSKEPFDLTALMENGSGLLNDVHGSVNDIRGRVDRALDTITTTVNQADGLMKGVRPDITRIARNGTQITEQINALVADLNAGKGPAGMLLKDEATRQQLQATLTNVQQASNNLNQVSARANETMEDFQSRQLVAKMQVTLENVQSLSQQLNTTITQALAKDNIGQDGATNLRETLSSLNRSTTNLAEDTEALKHNLFLRGFFKRRGFYSLDQLTRPEYVKALDRQKDPGTRVWLPASTLFAEDVNGQMELSQAGRQLIDAELASAVDSLPGDVIVVEGYAAAGSPDQQYVESRKRADLVRRYLEAHFHLRHSDLGIVAMRNDPPKSADKNSWNGAAVMLLQTKSSR